MELPQSKEEKDRVEIAIHKAKQKGLHTNPKTYPHLTGGAEY